MWQRGICKKHFHVLNRGQVHGHSENLLSNSILFTVLLFVRNTKVEYLYSQSTDVSHVLQGKRKVFFSKVNCTLCTRNMG